MADPYSTFLGQNAPPAAPIVPMRWDPLADPIDPISTHTAGTRWTRSGRQVDAKGYYLPTTWGNPAAATSVLPSAGGGGGSLLPSFGSIWGGLNWLNDFGRSINRYSSQDLEKDLPAIGQALGQVPWGPLAKGALTPIALTPFMKVSGWGFGSDKDKTAPATRSPVTQPTWANPLLAMAPSIGYGKKLGKKDGGGKEKTFDPYASVWASLNTPPKLVSYTPPPFPKPRALTNKTIEAAIARAVANEDAMTAAALSRYWDVAKKVANAPDMSKQAKKDATTWINAQIHDIMRMQDQERAAGVRTANQLRASAVAGANLQKGIGDVVGRAYANAAGALGALGQGIGAGVTQAAQAGLEGIGTVAPGAATTPVAGGQLPGAVPAAAGQAVSTLGGAIPALSLATQGAGVMGPGGRPLPGYVTGGATNVAAQTAAQLLAGGNQMALGAELAGEQRARDLNAKILEARGQFPTLFRQILTDLNANQNARNAAALQIAQQGLQNVFTMAGKPVERAYKAADRFREQQQYLSGFDVGAYNAATKAGYADAQTRNAQALSVWSTRVKSAISMIHNIATENAALAKAGGKTLTPGQFDKKLTAYSTLPMILSGQMMYAGKNTPGVYGPAQTEGGKTRLTMIQPPKHIDEAFRYMSKNFPTMVGSPTGTAEEQTKWRFFMNNLKEAYGVPYWSDIQVQRGIGRIPNTNFIARLPIDPRYTHDGVLIQQLDPKKADENDAHEHGDYNDDWWLDFFEETTPGFKRPEEH